MRNSFNRRNTLLKIGVGCAGVFLLLYLVRHFIFASLVQGGVAYAMQEKLEYQRRSWEDGSLIYDTIVMGDQIQAAQLRLTPHLRLFPFHLSIEVYLTEPHFKLASDTPSHFNWAFLIPTRWISSKVDIERGSLSMDGEPLGFIDFISSPEEDSLGKFLLSSDETNSCCSFELSHRNSCFFYHLNLDQISAFHLQSLLTFFNAQAPFRLEGGKINADLKGSFSLEDDWDCKGEVTGWDVQLATRYGECDFHHLQLQGEGGSQLLLSCDGHIDGSRFQNDFLCIEDAQGSISMHADQPSKLRLKGHLSYENTTAPFDCDAVGNITHRDAKNLEGMFRWHHIQFPFSYAHNLTSTVLHADLNQVPLALCSNIFGSFLNQEWRVDAGTISMSLAAYFDQNSLDSLALQEIDLRGVGVSQKNLSFDSMQGEVVLSYSPEVVVEKADLKIEGVVCREGIWNVTQGKAHLSIRENCFQPSQFLAEINQIPTQLSWEGAWDKIKGNLQVAAQSIDVHGALDLKSQLWKGEFQSPSIDLGSFSPYLPEAVLIEGNVALRGMIHASEVQATLQGSDLLVQTPSLLYQTKGSSPSLEVSRSFNASGMTARLECPPSTLHLKELSAPIHIESGIAVWKDGALEISKLQACLESTVFQGKLTYNHPASQLQLVAEQLEGNLSDLCTIQNELFQKSLTGWEGRFICGKDDFVMIIDLKEKTPHMQVKAQVEDLSYTITDQIVLDKGTLQLNYHSIENSVALTQASATLSLPHHQIVVQIPSLKGKGRQFSFSAFIPGESISVAGELDLREKISVRIDDAKIGTSTLQEPLFYSWDHQQWLLQGKATLALDSLPHYVALAQDAGLWTEITVPSMEGELKIAGRLSSAETSLDIQSTGIHLPACVLPALKGHIERQGSVWTIDDLLIGETHLKAEVLEEPQGWQIRHWSALSGDFRLQGTARLQQGICSAQASGTWKEKLSLKGGFNWNFHTQEAAKSYLQLQQDSMTLHLSCDLLKLSEGNLLASSVQTTLEHPALKESIQALLSLSLSPERALFQGPLTQGKYENDLFQLKGSEIHAMYEKGVLHFQTKLQLNETPIKAKGYFIPLEGGRGAVQVFEGDHELQLFFSAFDVITRIEGHLWGTDCSLQRKGESFEGRLKLHTSDPLSLLLQKPEWKQFENFEFTGSLQPEKDGWSFQGNLEGQEAAIYGSIVSHFQASIDYHPTHFEVRQLKIDDEAGHLVVKECRGLRSHPLKAWEITIPHIRGQHIQPSLIRKPGQAQPTPKPFQIRQLTLTQISGIVGRPLTFRGFGSLYFTQKEKRDPSLFDLPRSFLKEWGLDLALLSPVRGVCDIELQQGKVMFKALKETFSEGEHSEFSLSESEPSYIDFKGGLFLNLRVKQSVALKLAEPFTLSVRGSWEKPHYTLR